MRRLFLGCTGLMVACAPATNVSVSDRLDGPWGTLNFAYVHVETGRTTPDGDDVTTEILTLADDPNLCETAGVDGSPGPGDVTFVQIVWTATMPPSGRTSATAWALPGAVRGPSDTAMSGRAWWQSEGDAKVVAQPTCCGTPRISVDVTSRSEEGALEAGTFEIHLEQDFGVARPYDTDANGDGVPDYRALDERVTGRFERVQLCPK